MKLRTSSDKGPTAGFTLFEAMIATALIAMILAPLRPLRRNGCRIGTGVQTGFNAMSTSQLVWNGLAPTSPLRSTFRRIETQRCHSLRWATRNNFYSNWAWAECRIRAGNRANCRSSQRPKGPAVVRSRLPFSPATTANRQSLQFADPVVLLRIPYRLSFAYAGRDRIWRDEWRSNAHLPQAIKVTLHDVGGQQLFFSTAVQVHTELSIDCLHAKSLAECLTKHLKPPSDQLGNPRS